MTRLSKTFAAAGFAGALGLIGLAAAPALAQQHFRTMGGWHGSTMHRSAFRDRDDRMGFRDRDDRFRFRDRDDRFRFRDRDRFAFGVGFYGGGWPYYDYPYYASSGYYAPYGYGYDYGYCDPYSDYYDQYYCSY